MDAEATEAAEVMARYCRGDAAGFHHLYQRLAPRLLAYLVGLVRDKAAAEDILQLTFLKIHEARATYIIGANPIPWIYTVAHRTCLDELRKRKRSRVRLTKDGTLGRRTGRRSYWPLLRGSRRRGRPAPTPPRPPAR